MTHTLAVLEVLPTTYEDIRSRLEGHGYGHAFSTELERIDMTGLAILPMLTPPPQHQPSATPSTLLKSYRHYKGGTYTLLMIARNSDAKYDDARDEHFAVYVSHQTQQVWVRPLDDFNELVVWGDGVRRPRFTEWTPDEPATMK